MLDRTAIVMMLTVLTAACGGGDDRTGAENRPDAARGEELFAASCAVCHGSQGSGTRTGPPLVHEYYVPSHHADEAFQRAVQGGVQPHHWNFGPMPPVAGLERSEVADIIAYVRALQRDAGLID